MDTRQAEAVVALTPAEEELLLHIARAALERAIQKGYADDAWLPPVELPDRLREEGASFVTLHVDGRLRGCVGSVHAYRPLATDVAHNAMRAGLCDPRFNRVVEDELPRAEVEISILTPLTRLECRGAADLVSQIRPQTDGVMLVRGIHRGLLLPQTWQQVPDVQQFLAVLCEKAGLPEAAYLEGDVEVYTFQVRTIAGPGRR